MNGEQVLVSYQVGEQSDSSKMYIATPEQLQGVKDLGVSSSNHSGVSYELVKDVNLASADVGGVSNWDGGDGFTNLGEFEGSFDRNGHTISNLYINRPEMDTALVQEVKGGL